MKLSKENLKLKSPKEVHQDFRHWIVKDGPSKVLSSLACILVSLILAILVLTLLDVKNGCENVFYEFGQLITGGLQYRGIDGFYKILTTAAPLVCCGLSICFAYKTGMFNIGAAGQYVLGMFGGLMFALQFKCHWSICLLMGFVFGAIWAAIPGLLKAFFNVSEVIGGIMLNWIGLYFVNYSWQTYLRGCLDGTKGYKTLSLASTNSSALIPTMKLGDGELSIAILFALIATIIVWFIMSKTILGFELRASGLNKDATRYAGMNEKKNIILSMAIAGALAGLGGALYYLTGLEQWEGTISTSLPGVPWNGIVVAFVGQINPFGTLFASLFVALITQGAKSMTQSIFPSEVSDLIVAIIVYLSGLSSFAIVLYRKHLEKKKMKHDMITSPNAELVEEVTSEYSVQNEESNVKDETLDENESKEEEK